MNSHLERADDASLCHNLVRDMSYVFLSHSHHDLGYVKALAEYLQSAGLQVWYSDLIEYGAEWPREIEEKLDEASALILVVTPNAKESDWVHRELNRALRTEKPVFPVLLEGELWLEIETTQYVDARGGDMPPDDFATRIGQVLDQADEYRPLVGTPSTPRFSIDISEPPGHSIFDGEKAAYFRNVWVVNHTDTPLILEFNLTLLEREFPASDLAFRAVRFKDAMAFHEVYRQADEAVHRQYLSNPLSLDARANRMGSLAFLQPVEIPLIPDQQYENWIMEVRDVHTDGVYQIESVGKHSFG